MRLYSFLHETPLSLRALVTTFTAIIATRLLIESWIHHFAPRSGIFYLTETTHTVFFFATLFIACLLLVSALTRKTVQATAVVLLYGFLLTVCPPVLDMLIAQWFYSGVPFWSYALFDGIAGLWQSLWTFFGDSPTRGITYGTRIMIATAIIGISGYVYAVTRTAWRAIVAGSAVYILCFIMSAFPSLITILLHDTHLRTTGADVAGFIISPATILTTPITDITSSGNIKMSLVYAIIIPFLVAWLWYTFRPTQCIALLRNIRPVQTLYHSGLLLLGMLIAWHFTDATILWNPFSIMAIIVALLAVIMAWYATVIFNDIVDIDIDRISNPRRPLITHAITIRDYRSVGVFLTILSCVYIAILLPHAALLLIGYHTLSYLYNTPPLRLKRFPVIATFLAAIASFFIVAIGFILINPAHDLQNFPMRIGILLIIAYTISLPLKDLKDIRGDKKHQIFTIPVLFGERTGRVIIGSGIFTAFLLSVFLLNVRMLFIPALCCGSVAFWAVTAHRAQKFRFTPHSILWTIFGIVTIYAMSIAIVFFRVLP